MWKIVPWRLCELTCDYLFPTSCVYIQCVSHPRFYQANILHRPSLYFYSLPAVVPTRLLMVHHSAPALSVVIALDQLSQAFLPPPYLHTTSSRILAVGTALYHIGKWGDTPIILFAVVTVATWHFDPVY